MTEFLTSPYQPSERYPVHPDIEMACHVPDCVTRHPVLYDGTILGSSVAADWSRVRYKVIDGIPLIVCKEHPEAGVLDHVPRPI